jgi:hypothetical protein
MPPKYLYKFEKLDVQTLRNLKNAQVYFSTPASFNDPFDCSVLEASIILRDNDVVELFKRYLKAKGKRADFEINSTKDIPEEDVDQIHLTLEKKLKNQQDKFLNKTGCTCFSEINDNILL